MLSSESSPPLTIPTGHNTAAIRVLSMPQIKSLVGEYPRNYFYDIESKRRIIGLDGNVPAVYLDRAVCDTLLASYMSTVHAHHPILDSTKLLGYYEKSFEQGISETIESAIVLVVLALGEVASAASAVIIPRSRDKRDSVPGIGYFTTAFNIISREAQFDFGANVLVAQAQVLVGVYFAYIVHPLSSWRIVHQASITVQLIISRVAEMSSLNDDEVKLFWSCFLIESDRLAEFELPRSGIESLVDDMPLPSVSNSPDSVIIYFLAEISIRRLLNRVHSTLYADNHDRRKVQSTGNMIDICEELNRQLETWHESIPAEARPTLGKEPPETGNEREIILRIRYYACRHIIFRPFVLRVIAGEDFGSHESQVLENCVKCISSIRMYIHNIGHELLRPSPYTWTLAMSSFGGILVVTAASQSPILQRYVPDILELQAIVLNDISQWAKEDSSIKSIIWIIEHIKHRQEFFART